MMPRGFASGWLSVVNIGEIRAACAPTFPAFKTAFWEWAATVTSQFGYLVRKEGISGIWASLR